MEIKELTAGQGKVDIVVEVIDKGEIKEFEKFGRSGRVCETRAKDQSGDIALTLWNDQIDQVNVGDKVKITNGYVSEYQGEKKLSTGKFGQLEVVSGASAEADEPNPEPEEQDDASEDSPAEDDDEGMDEMDVDEEKI
jgi:replication factor A1